MALHMIRSTPNFTRSMRGYDIEEVDEYVDALRESEDEQVATLAAAEEANRLLKAEIERLRGRIAELEGCIRSETPRSIAALGERLTLVLEQAEAGADEAVRSAREEAETLIASARATTEAERLLSGARTVEAEELAATRISDADELARTTEATAKSRADEIIRDAEARALARRREIEAWVERVRAHIEGEETRAAEEFTRVRALRNHELTALERRREAMFASLREMAESLRAMVAAAKASTDGGPEALGEPGAGRLVPGSVAAPDACEVAEPPALQGAGTPSDASDGDEPPADFEAHGSSSASATPHAPSAAEQSALDAFFGPEVTPVSEAAPTADRHAEESDGAAMARPITGQPPFDVEAVDGLVESDADAGFYSSHRIR